MKKMRKGFSLLLSMAMVLGMMPVQGYATDCLHEQLAYSAEGDCITESCKNESCGHKATATLTLDETVSLAYTGEAIQPLKVQYSDGWLGKKDTVIIYDHNIEVTPEQKPAEQIQPAAEEQTENDQQPENSEESQENTEEQKIPTGTLTIGGVSAAKTFQITKGQLTVSAVVTVSYGDEAPNVEVIYKNAQGEKVTAVLNGQPNVTTDYSKDMNAGDEGAFVVELNGASSEQYELTAENGKFTVGQREVTLVLDTAEIVYDGQAHTPKVTAGNLAGADEVGLEYKEVTQTMPGTYAIEITGLTGEEEVLKNYKLPEDTKVSFTIRKAPQDKPTEVKVVDGKITGVDTTMEYKAADAEESAYEEVEGTEITGLEPGAYHVRYAESDTAVASKAVEVTVIALEMAKAPAAADTNKLKVNVTAVSEEAPFTLSVKDGKTEVNQGESVTIVYTLKAEQSGSARFAVLVNGAVVLSEYGEYTISDIKEDINVTVAPLVAIKFNEETFLDVEKATTEWKDTKENTFEILSAPGATSVEHAIRDDHVELSQIKEWSEKKTALPDGKRVIYAKVTYDFGTYYASTYGVVVDTVVPEIKIGGVKAENSTLYHTTQIVTVTDNNNLDVVKLDNVVKSQSFELKGDKVVNRYKIEATDKAGNKIEVWVKMQTIESLKDPIKDLTTSTMKPDNKEDVKDVLTEVSTLTTSDADEKAKIDGIKTFCENLLQNVNYSITTKAANLKWEKSSGKDFVIETDAKGIELTNLLIDEKEITNTSATKNFSYDKSTGKLTIKSTFLQKTAQTVGKHEIQLVFKDGETSGADQFEIQKAGTNPKTGDNTILFWMTASLVSVAGLAAILSGKKKHYQA